MDVVKRDLKDVDISWDEAEELALRLDRAEWRQCVAQCNAPIWMQDELRSKVGKLRTKSY